MRMLESGGLLIPPKTPSERPGVRRGKGRYTPNSIQARWEDHRDLGDKRLSQALHSVTLG